jgi:proteasome activator subunit 4
MIACVEPVNSGFCITDPADPRYRYFEMLRRRFGECLHQASVVLQKQGEENTLDAVAMLVCRALLTP